MVIRVVCILLTKNDDFLNLVETIFSTVFITWIATDENLNTFSGTVSCLHGSRSSRSTTEEAGDFFHINWLNTVLASNAQKFYFQSFSQFVVIYLREKFLRYSGRLQDHTWSKELTSWFEKWELNSSRPTGNWAFWLVVCKKALDAKSRGRSKH